jgi:hypothetical protein
MKNEEILWQYWYIIQKANIWITGVHEGLINVKVVEHLLKEITREKSPNLEINTSIQVQKD